MIREIREMFADVSRVVPYVAAFLNRRHFGLRSIGAAAADHPGPGSADPSKRYQYQFNDFDDPGHHRSNGIP